MGWLLASYSAVVVRTNRRKFREMMPIVVAILMTTEAFFISLITFVVSPFQVLMVGKGIIGVPMAAGSIRCCSGGRWRFTRRCCIWVTSDRSFRSPLRWHRS